jgi:hypothetical protein
MGSRDENSRNRTHITPVVLNIAGDKYDRE